MKDLKHAKQMLLMAKKDFKAMKGMLDPKHFDEEIFGFHVQQAVEKSIKAWISFVGREYPKTHDLSSLLQILSDTQNDTSDLFEFIEYNTYAVQYRYEAFEMEEPPIDRKAVIKKVGRLIKKISTLLSKKSSPS